MEFKLYNIPLLTTSKKEELFIMGVYACFEKGSSMTEIVQVAKELKSLAEAKLKES